LRYLVFLGVALSFGLISQAFGDECEKEARLTHKVLMSQIKELEKALPPGSGITVDSGECVIRTLRLGIGFGHFRKTLIDRKDGENKIACLEVADFYEEQLCKCKQLGIALQNDPEIEKRVHEKVELLKKAQKFIRDHAIKNQQAREWIEKAQEVHNCYSEQTVTILNTLSNRIDETIGMPRDGN